jgi:hypothetical protein
MASSLPTLLFTLSSLSSLSAAYTWKFDAAPQQCSNLTVSVTGSGGKPPYRILVLPIGPTPLTNNLEVRRILDQQFPDDSTTVSFQLKYPANSQLVTVVSTTFYQISVSSLLLSLHCRWRGCFQSFNVEHHTEVRFLCHYTPHSTDLVESTPIYRDFHVPTAAPLSHLIKLNNCHRLFHWPYRLIGSRVLCRTRHSS